MEDDRLMQSMLFDFYGELLTDRQRDVYNLYYNEDLSLTEIGEMRGTTRQAVWDMIRHANASMLEIEEKTGLIERFLQTRKELESVVSMLKKEQSAGAQAAGERLEALLSTL